MVQAAPPVADGRSHLYEFDRRWLLNEIANDYRAYQQSMDRGAPDLVAIGRMDARLLVGLQFDLLSHQEEANLRAQYLAEWMRGPTVGGGPA